MIYHLLLFLHVIGACVLLGTGAGIAFFMLMAHRTQNPRLIAHTAGTVILADTIFTMTAVIVQPITGYLLAREVGWSMGEGWIIAALGLYVVTGVFWLPVVWIQIQLRNLANHADQLGEPLPDRYHRLFNIWFACGSPAFAAVLGIIWLMITKPVLF